MRIDQVRATAFGPLRGARLDLAPGLTVVHGPNEAGKSSWFAATYAGLAGRRRARGRGTKAQALFSQRHKPWTGSQWSAGVTLTLDDGSTWAIEQDLRSNGDGRIVDVTTGQPTALAVYEQRLGRTLVTDGGLDGARILGLNRDSARSTIFVAQADVLRVMDDASELQELLERVAATNTADVTTEAALQWLTRLRSERVGVAHIGSRPLRATTLALTAARDAATGARDHWTALLDVLTARQDVDAQLDSAVTAVRDLESAQQWLAINQLERRLDQARALSSVVEEPADSPADEEALRRATVLLGAFERRGERPTQPEGPDSAALQASLADLHDHPEGDLEPRTEVLQAHEALTRAMSAVETHGRVVDPGRNEWNGPAHAVGADVLRGLAGKLAEPVPAVDEGLVARLRAAEEDEDRTAEAFAAADAGHRAAVERNRARHREYQDRLAAYRVQHDEYTARLRAYDEAVAAAARAEEERVEEERAAAAATPSSGSRSVGIAAAVIGGVVLVAGVVLIVLGQLVPGCVVAIVGAVLAALGLARSRTPAAASAPPLPSTARSPIPVARPVAPTPPEAPDLEPADSPARPELSGDLARLRTEVAARQMAVESHQRALDGARNRALELGLPADPDELNKLARAVDDAVAARERAEAHAARAGELREQRDGAVHRLAELLGVGLAGLPADGRVDAVQGSYNAYVDACRERAQQAASASRRADLAQALEQRLEVELAHQRAIESWERAELEVATLADELGLPGEAHPAERVRSWLSAQEQLRVKRADRREQRGRLEQVLDGRTVEELAAELDTLRAGLGDPPPELPDDVESRLETARSREQALRGQAGALRGQQHQLTSDARSVARALEEEAAAERAAARVGELASAFDSALSHLEAAKERSHASVAPALENIVRPRIPQVTGGRYLDVKVNPADLTMKVTEASGAVRDAHLLSHGTTEQLYLLLRLALAQTLASVDEAAPLVLDDVTVQSDRERTTAVLDLLHQVSEERQVILFSQEDEVVAWAQAHLQEPRDRLVALPAVAAG